MSLVERWAVLLLGVVTFVVAAKAHGRQLRLERELLGYWKVSFGGLNPPFIDALWRRERFAFWSLEGAVLGVTVFGRALVPDVLTAPLPDGAGGSFHGAVLLHGVLPPIVAFLATGLWSAVRCALPARGAVTAIGAPLGWRPGTLTGLIGWWALALGLVAVLVRSAWL